MNSSQFERDYMPSVGMPETNPSLTQCGLSSGGEFYKKAIHGLSSPTPVSNRFFAEDNVRYLQKQLEFLLTQMVGQPVRVPVNEEFYQSMNDIAGQNAGYAFLGDYGLQQLNAMFVQWEARIQYISIRQQKLYDQYFIKENRILHFPYPQPTKAMKGELVVDTSGYMLTNPWGNQFGNYLQDVYGTAGTKSDKQCYLESISKPVETMNCIKPYPQDYKK